MSNSKYQLTPFEVGQVKAHMSHGLGCTSIASRVFKADGKSKFSEEAIRICMNKLKNDPAYRGEREEGSGAPRKTDAKQDKKVIQWVLKRRGKEKISVSRLKQKFPFLRKLGNSAVEDRLHDADLEFLRRRKKPIVEKQYLAERITYCQSVKRKHQSTLDKWAYTDGTVYYLDRNDSEHENTVRAALGTHVWRKSDNSDALWDECIGPSSYNKGQGIPVKIWGFLAMGVLHVHVLDHRENMDQDLYTDLIEDKFEEWAGNCEYLVCDYEGCLRCEMPLNAIAKAGLKLVDSYPRTSQDFNAIENAWKIVKERLNETVPTYNEGRNEFIQRYMAAVRWVNKNRSHQLWYLSTNQKERADDCLAQKPKGGRTKW